MISVAPDTAVAGNSGAVPRRPGDRQDRLSWHRRLFADSAIASVLLGVIGMALVYITRNTTAAVGTVG